jgi:glycosyltransferase involved in cell wall biosynthesis
MHVLFVNARYTPEGIAGPAFTTQYLAEQLVRDGDRATVICRTDRPGVYQEVLEGVNLLRIGMQAPARQLLEILVNGLDFYRPDVIHTIFPRDFPLGRLATLAEERRTPLVHTLLAYFLLCHEGSLMRDGKPCRTQCPDCREATGVQRFFAERVSAVVGISQYMLDLHCRWGLFQDVPVRQVIHDAYEPPGPVTPSATTGKPLRLGYLGRLDALKGIDLLLQTLTTELRERDWALVLGGCGDPAYESMLKTRYVDPRIRFLGFVNPTDLLSQIDVLVVPSLWEDPFPRVTFEAYAHAVPVVGSARGGIPEGIEAGRTGLVFDPGHDGALAGVIATLLDDPQLVDNMKANAMDLARSAFTPTEILRRYRSVYVAASSNVRPAVTH